MNQSIRKLEEESSNNNLVSEDTNQDIKLDKTKDYIYYTDSEEIVHELDLIYKNVNLNFQDKQGVAKVLNDETIELKQTLTYDKTVEDAPYDNLISAQYKIYTTFTYDKYISLIVDYYEYHYETLVTAKKSKTYIFDKTTGNLLNSNQLLDDYDLTEENIRTKIANHLADEDIAKEGEVLDIESTLAEITELNLFVDKIGRLSITILVKSDQKDYNEVIILN